MFSCKCCPEKDKRIEDLKAQISFLEKMLNPSVPHAVNMEMNKILDGSALPVMEVSSDEAKELERIQREETAILTGNYAEGY